MKILNYILLSLLSVFYHQSLLALSTNDTVNIDSTMVRYFHDNTNNQDLGFIYTWDTTTMSASYYDPTNPQFECLQELSNAGHAHQNMELSYPTSIGFKNELPAFKKIKNELYKDYNIYVIEANRNINSNGKKRGKVEEVIITNFINER